MNILAYIAQLIGGFAVMLLGAIMAAVSAAVGENSLWKGLLCVLIAILLCALGILFSVVALRSLLCLS